MKRLVYSKSLFNFDLPVDSVALKPYKGYNIEKSWNVDESNNPIPGTVMYQVIDEEDDWIGDMYKSLADAKRYIDELVSGK